MPKTAMFKTLKCPRCQEAIDVVAISPGSTVRCPNCGQLARVPTGATSVRTKPVPPPPSPVSPPAQAPPLRPGSSPRVTRIRERSRSGQTAVVAASQSNSGLLVGLSIGGLGIVIVVILFSLKGQNDELARPRGGAEKGPGSSARAPASSPSFESPLGPADAKPEAKSATPARLMETAETVNWDHIMRQLRPAGGFDHEDRPEGVAFRRVKSFGKAAYPRLVAYIDDEDTAIGTAAVVVLNALTGRDSPFPKGATKAKVKAEWEEWLKTGGEAAKPNAPQVINTSKP